jgi:hypothetical protein
MKRNSRLITLLLTVTILFSACAGAATTTEAITEEPTATYTEVKGDVLEATPSRTPTLTPTTTFTPTATFTPTRQSFAGSTTAGPQPDDFPTGFNPLTGQLAGDPELLNLPAILISITNFPPSARPQAGLSFAPLIFEIYISEGMTRFLVSFYGEEPRFEEQVVGDCAVREEPFEPTNLVLGNLVWLDVNLNGIQEPEEPGIGGVCVTLYDTAGNQLQTTSTDSNGYYGFNVPPGVYMVEFDETASLGFTTPDVGFDDLDSDADPLTGMTIAVTVYATDMNWDAGLVRKLATPTPTGTFYSPTPAEPGGGNGGGGDTGGPPAVGPIRSMRWPYVYIRNFFTGSCLVSASGDPTVLAHAPGCSYAFGSDEDDINSAFIDVTKMRQIAEEQKAKNPGQALNYTGNVFSEQPPAGGLPAQDLRVFYSFLNQTFWNFDPLSSAYVRYDDNADGSGIFHPSTDRLTGRQLLYDNVIVMFAGHSALAPTIIDINLQPGNFGPAYLFRNGEVYKIYWSTMSGVYEQTTQLQRPIRFVDQDGKPFPLKPGHTWVHVFSTQSYVEEESPSHWFARFIAPAGSK